jgi:uncharacterized GH25 family protein
MRLLARTLASVLVFSGLVATTSAHDTWLAPAADARAGRPLRFHLTSGGAFPASEHGVEGNRMVTARLRAGRVTAPLRTVARRSDVLVLEAPAVAGLATAWVALKPRVLELSEAQVAEYLGEIGEERLADRWARRAAPKRWRETYRKHAKAFVSVGEAAGDASWQEPVGLDLEIVPETSPVGLSAGDTLTVRVLKGGAPLGGLPLRAARAGDAGKVQRTDAEGRASFRLDRVGPWLLAGTDLRESAQRAGEWESDFTTLTLEVGR